MRLSVALAPVTVAALVLALVPACGDARTRISVNAAPGFSAQAPKVSVFGVFRDGRMNPEAWEDLSPRFRTVLHGEACDAAVGSALRTLNPPLFSAVDGKARRAGISDEMLERFAPAAEGENVLVVMISGKAPEANDGGDAAHLPPPTGQTPGMRRGRQSGPGMAPTTRGMRGGYGEMQAFEVSAWLYAKREKKSVFMQSMIYTGASESEAVGAFVAKLGEALPGATCAPWKADLGVDPHAIEDLPDE